MLQLSYSETVVVLNGILHFCRDISLDDGKKN